MVGCGKLMPWLRMSQVARNDDDDSNIYEFMRFGLTWWPIENVAFKMDYGTKTKKYSEDETPKPLSFYGKTKLNAENIVLSGNDRNVVLRTTVIYGHQKRSRFTQWVLENLKNQQPVTAFTDQYNTPTLVDDLSKAIVKIIELDLSGLFHASGKTCINRYDFALKLADKFHLDKELVLPTLTSEKNQAAPRPKNGCLDSTKLENLIGMEFCDIDSGISFIHSQIVK